MNTETIINHLRQVELFSTLKTGELDQICNRIAIKNYSKNEIILFPGDTNNNIYMIFSGEVKVTHATEDGKEVILAIHQTGEIFGETTLVGLENSPAIIVTTKPTITAVISKEDLYNIMASHSDIIERLFQILSARLCHSWELIQMLNFNNAPQRIRTLLVILAKRHGRRANEETILNIRLTHQSIANMTGLTRETVTRVIDTWQKNGNISIKNKLIQLNPAFMQ